MRIDFVATRKNQDRSERELYEMDLMLRVLGFQRSFLDLGIQTVAACTPPGHPVRIVDEYLEEIDYDAPADLVALSAKTSCVTHAYRVADRFRARGKRVVLGGIHASLRPDEALAHVDCVVTGEAETLWPQVVADAARGKLAPRYDAAGYPPMERVPVPAWHHSPTQRYLFHQLQTTRGCPFRCRFCSVPDISGQDFRFKPVSNVLAELAALPRAGGPIARAKPLYIVDDNFISRNRYTKDLLKAMVPLARAGRIPAWSAETTLNVAVDEEMLDLFAAAGCSTMIIGFESVSEATLADMDKPVNFCLTYPEAVARIHARGMTVVGNFIVGFDTDRPEVFKETLDFIQQTGILYPFFSILTPMPGTALHEEVKAAGRIDHFRWELYDTRHVVFQPAQMSREELQDGYIWLYEQAYGSDKLLERIERNWRAAAMRGVRGASLVEKAFVTARLGLEVARWERAARRHAGEAIKLLFARGLAGDPGQLLFVLDGFDFARFLGRFKSSRYAEHAARFAAGRAASPSALQWQNEKALRRTERLAGA